MAKIKRINKINRNVSACEEIHERRVDRSLVDVNALNSRRLYNNDRNRRVLLTLKSYSNLLQSGYFSKKHQPAVRKPTVNMFTQTSENRDDSIKISAFTQTQDLPKFEKNTKIVEDNVRKSKSDSSVLGYHRKTNSGQIKAEDSTKMGKKLIFMYKKQSIGHSKGTRRGRIKNRIGIKTKTRIHSKKNSNHSKNKEKLAKNTVFGNENTTTFYHSFNEKMRGINSTTIAEWSSKIFRLFSDLGISLTESVINLYKYYESQKYQTSDIVCDCHQKIEKLTSKLESLMHNIAEEHARTKNADLEQKIEEIQLKLEHYDSLQSELAELKKQLKKEAPSTVSPPAPPPPPPPPLPVFFSTNSNSKSFLNVVQSERKIINYENPRPIITLEDILKVKLKKISVTNI